MLIKKWLSLSSAVLLGGCCNCKPAAPAPTTTASALRLPAEDGAKVGMQGAIEITNRPFDLAICGNGFFHIKIFPEVGGGDGYTRKGALRLDENGDLVTTVGGNELIPVINIPNGATGVDIDRDGTVSFVRAGTSKRTKAGQIWLTCFVNPLGLKTESAGVYTATDVSGSPHEFSAGENGSGELISGSLEAAGDGPVVDVSYQGRGTRLKTCRSMDVAIQGDGFLHVKVPHGIRGDDGYTRYGRLVIDGDSDLAVTVADQQYKLVPPIWLPMSADAIAIDADGTVSYCRTGGPRTEVGRIELMTFDEPQNLKLDHDGIYGPADPNERAIVKQDGRLMQGFLETPESTPGVAVARAE